MLLAYFVSSFLQLRHGWSLSPLWQSNKLKIFLKCGVFPCWFHFLHRARSQPSDLGPPDLMPYACFARLTCSTDRAWSTTVFSHLCLPHVDRWMELLCSHPKPLTIFGHPNQYHWFLERGSRLYTFSAFVFFTHGFPASHAFECSGFSIMALFA